MIKVLVTGAGALLGQGIIRALQAASLDVRIIAVDPEPLAAGLYWVDSAYIVPLAESPKYLPRICSILNKERPDILLIGTDVELGIFSEHRQRLETKFKTRIVVSSPQVVAIANDKWLTYKFLKDNHYGYPKSCLPGGEWDLIRAVGFPLVVKPRIGARSVGVHVVNSHDALNRVVSHESIIQECIATKDDEYTAGVVVFGDRQVSIVMRRTLRDGNTYQAFIEGYPDLNRKVCELANTLRPLGPVNFQFRLMPTGEIKVFEINARFSGTTPLRVSAGFNEVEMVVRSVLNGDKIVQPKIESMIILRHWSETIVKLNQFDAVASL